MGCDIHAHVELKLADGAWHHYNAPYIERNYDLFAKLAGVRNYKNVTPIALPRGLPSDISPMTRLLRVEDGRSGGQSNDSWIDRKEIYELEQWWDERVHPYEDSTFVHRNVFELAVMGGYLVGNGYGYELPEGILDVRLVFWFDN
jgi:hypothetical protein